MIETTRYYDEYLRYFQMAKLQQDECNLGSVEYAQSTVNDDLMKNVHLYDVVDRKFAGFSQIVNDVFYGWTSEHPYWHKMEVGNVSWQRKQVATAWTGKHADFGLPEWLYVFILHRVCGSGINYSTKPSGYHNTLLFDLHEARSIEGMVDIMNGYKKSFYTSVGYQFPAFPKPPAASGYKRGGDYFLSEFAPQLSRELAEFLSTGRKFDLREIGSFMFDWNVKHGLRQYKFQYAAVIADIADWFPELANRESMFYYGTNAVECISYLANPVGKTKRDKMLDEVMERIYEDTGAFPYNAEDVCCDFIRWIENYVKPGADYDHLDFDAVWNSSSITDHPYGRQRAMLELGLLPTFNGMTSHPSDDFVLAKAGVTMEKYAQMINERKALIK